MRLVRELVSNHLAGGPRVSQHQRPQPDQPQVAARAQALREDQGGRADGQDPGGCLFVCLGEVQRGAAEAPGGNAQAAACAREFGVCVVRTSVSASPLALVNEPSHPCMS